MRKISILFLSIFVNVIVNAQQTDYFWNNNTKINIEKITTKKYITFDKTISDTATLKQILGLPNSTILDFGKLSVLNGLNKITDRTTEDNWAIIEGINLSTVTLSTNSLILSESPFYLTSNNKELGFSHLFYVKLFQSTDLQILKNLAQQYNIDLLGSNKYMPLWHTLSCNKNSTGSGLQMANLFKEIGLFAYVEPDMMMDDALSCVDDQFFANQWGLLNTGQHQPAYSGIDINACQAWGITQGNSNVIVAVVDNGIDVNHPDLTNQHPVSYDTETSTSPSQIYGSHGTRVSGIIGANSNNTDGVAGIASSCPLMTISNAGSVFNPISRKADGINFAWINGASVINNSWNILFPSQLVEDAILDALNLGRNGLGCVVVFSAGNDNSSVAIPANSIQNPDIITVGAMSPCGERKSPSSCDGFSWGSNFGLELDIMAPGILIPTTHITGVDLPEEKASTYTQDFDGTSAAAPHVAAVAALILSVNPTLTQHQVADIIEQTAQKVRPDFYSYTNTVDRPNGTWHIEMGYGLVDAEAAVLLAQSMCTSTQLDLYTKDSYNDFGVEPNTTTTLPYLSNDIWVRNQAGLTDQTHQNPEHSSTNNPAQLNYVYVRVRNKGCVASDGTETLDLHWAKASTSLNYPANWNGTLDLDPPNNALAGNLISSQTIPAIPAGGEVILEFTWNPPSPDDYSFNTEPGHFCLLSKIVSTADPITPYTAIGAYVTENNNVAWKNLTVVDNVLGIITDGDCPQDMMQNIGVAVMVANPDNIAGTFDIKFSVPQEELSNPITTEGKITIALDEQLYEKWKQGGKKGTGIIEIKSPPMSETGVNNNSINDNAPISVSNRKTFEITGTSSSFDNITLAPNEVRTTSLMVTYPANPVSDKKLFNYDIIQKRSETGELIGGVRYAIQKPNCSNLIVDAGNNQTIKRGCSAALVAFSSSPLQPALGKDCSSYQWFDDSGKLIAEQSAVKITPNTTTTYTLKFTSTSGCTSEDQVTITVLNQLCKKEREIIKITPNPADDFITIDYKTLNTNNAHIRLLKTDNSIDRTYPLDLQNTQKTINVADCNFGSYVMILVCDGINEDSEIVIIQ